MFYIHVLRIKCEQLAQRDFFGAAAEPVDVISRSFFAKPTTDVGRGSVWHLGNIELLGGDGIAFAMGRTMTATSPKFDIENHDFLEEEVMRAPYTIGVFDQRTQTCGIIKKSGVSLRSTEISSKLSSLLNASDIPRQANMEIFVDPVRDPVSFIQALKSSVSVSRFSFTASRPNPHDVNRLIQRPAEDFTLATGGEKTTVEVEGEELNKEVLEEMAKAVAAVGETAAASIRPEPGARTKRIYLTGNELAEPVEATTTKSLLNAILQSTRTAYARVRNSLSS